MMEQIFMDPTEIKVRGGLSRYRTEMGEINSLMESITTKRQILPIVITRDNELIDGGRRLAACLLGGVKVKVVYEDVVDDFEFRELELEANLHAKTYTPAEEALAIADLHKRKQQRLGQSFGGAKSEDSGWSLQKTADQLGMTKMTVSRALDMAELVTQFPELRKAKKKSEIKKAGEAIQRALTTVEGLKGYEKTIAEGKTTFDLYPEDAVVHMVSSPKSSVDILCTDPFYGIAAETLTQGIGGKTGGEFTTAGYKLTDAREPALFQYHVLAKESIRFTTDYAHGYIFVAPENFETVRNMFVAAGWRCHIKPIIWIKREVGQCNVPTAWPASCYEMILFIRKDRSRLIKEGMPDWAECPPVPPSQKLHPFEKPVQLLTNLLERVSLPGHRLYDPYMGSGSSIEAGVRLKLHCIGVDIEKLPYANACARMAKVMEDLKGGKEDEAETKSIPAGETNLASPDSRSSPG